MAAMRDASNRTTQIRITTQRGIDPFGVVTKKVDPLACAGEKRLTRQRLFDVLEAIARIRCAQPALCY